MARKAAQNSAPPRGFNDITGIVLIGLSVLFCVAMLSFDARDISSNSTETNQATHNWIGPIGAWMAHLMFLLFGGGAYIVPLLLLVFGLGCFFEFLHHLRRRWVWAAILFICCLGLLDLYTDKAIVTRLGRVPNLASAGVLERMSRNLTAPSAGGVLGLALNQYVFLYFGRPGATIVFATLYFISLLFLTNFQLGEWVKAFARRRSEQSAEEQALEDRARALEKQARKLQDQMERSAKSNRIDARGKEAPDAPALGQDGMPVPEPMVRDLSVPVPRAKNGGKKAGAPEPEIAPPEEGVVISAQEIAAATTSDVLGTVGKTGEAKSGNPAPVPAIPPAADEEDAPLPLPLPAVLPARPRYLPKKNKPIAVAATPTIGNYKLPTLDILHHPDPNVKPTESKEELMANARLMQNTLAQFDIEVALGDITKGPTITRYELHPAPGVRTGKNHRPDQQHRGRAQGGTDQHPGTRARKKFGRRGSAQPVKTKVIMRDLLESEEWRNTKARIPLALGKDVYGHPIIADLAEMPHLLIAGSTGSGKSVCINSIIASLLYRFSPDQLRFVMIDPKVVELQQYNALPHLVVPVVNDPKKVILALRWVVNEMEKRYQIFAKVGVRNIKSFNERPKNKPVPPAEPELPLTAQQGKGRSQLGRLCGRAGRGDRRAARGRHRHSGKAQLHRGDHRRAGGPDVGGAGGRGNGHRAHHADGARGGHPLHRGHATPERRCHHRCDQGQHPGAHRLSGGGQGRFAHDSGCDGRGQTAGQGRHALSAAGLGQTDPRAGRADHRSGNPDRSSIHRQAGQAELRSGDPSAAVRQAFEPRMADSGDCDEDEDLIQQCIEVIRSEQKASVSLMQRRLRLGYTRAARIMDELENRGIVGPSKGAEPRDILIDLSPSDEEPAAGPRG